MLRTAPRSMKRRGLYRLFPNVTSWCAQAHLYLVDNFPRRRHFSQAEYRHCA